MQVSTGQVSIREIHWLMDLLQSIDIGLVVIDREFNVQLWNGFMENHSGFSAATVTGKNILKSFPEIPEAWFRNKTRSVFTLKNRSFTSWEQRDFLLKFKTKHPITGSAPYMYQNVSFMPLVSIDGTVDRIGLIIYDVTDIAMNKINLKRANEELALISRTDGLTQLNNRRYWEECLSQEYLRCGRSKHISTLIMFDIDHFKKVNDTYGHHAGDLVIQHTARVLLKSLRLVDIAGRYGGEEFALILPDTSPENGYIVAERIRQQIESGSLDYDGHLLQWTISLGIAGISDKLQHYNQWIELADKGLYSAKQNGRNKSVISIDALTVKSAS